ncbi:MarR family winged helix-turn-helix transcriptional regulator [Brevibacillus dissolubilis]|uniref:MarR family winged helix-turn-helix transcriptional regulator n=1 Tax=Brevibacillus dissolubilis TaxID=1844116 RepID=UPI001115F257|nr:MarR family transcriptional regulator [Brevibacillus dissolubilis]
MNECFNTCLFFTANRLSRIITKIGEEEFQKIGLSPTYAYLMMTVKDQPGITQKDLSEILHIAPSTSTRLIDKLVVKNLIERKTEGKLSMLYLTDKGLGVMDEINHCWKSLYARYSAILGEQEARALTEMIHHASETLDKQS